MKIRTDYTVREHVPFESISWVGSPGEGVERKMLERDGDEVASATSIVRYAPGSSFAEHVHERGEEFLVLEGTFQDEHGDYPAGTYVWNPPGSRHRPLSRNGCTIFVKLRQFAEDDAVRRVVRLGDGEWVTEHGHTATKELHEFGSERVSLVELAGNSTILLPGSVNGLEILVVTGWMEVAGAPCPPLTWVRSPELALGGRAESGCLLWMKRGHFPARVREHAPAHPSTSAPR
jgi:quercetin dioxygenase-like cupin family protein